MELRTARLALGFPTHEQVEGYYRAIVGTDIFDTLIWDGPASAADLHAYWTQARANFDAGVTHDLSLGVIERGTRELVGGVTLRPFQGNPEVIDLGYVLAKPFHGRGYATEAVRTLVDHGFAERGMERCFACVFVGNRASRRVLEKIGFAHEGTLRRSIKKRGEWKDEWMMAITRPEWEARSRG